MQLHSTIFLHSTKFTVIFCYYMTPLYQLKKAGAVLFAPTSPTANQCPSKPTIPHLTSMRVPLVFFHLHSTVPLPIEEEELVREDPPGQGRAALGADGGRVRMTPMVKGGRATRRHRRREAGFAVPAVEGGRAMAGSQRHDLRCSCGGTSGAAVTDLHSGTSGR